MLSTMVSALATFLAPVGGAVAAVVLLTVLVRLLLHPLTRSAVRGERARLRLAPQVAKLQRTHARNPTRLAEETLALYRKEGVSPVSGLWPTLAQAPFFLVLYQAFSHSTAGALFGVPLVAHFALGPQAWVFLGLFLALAALAWVSSRRAAMLMARAESSPTGLMARLPRILPYTLVATAAFVPLAVGLYLLTSSAWTVVENHLLRRGLV